MMNSRPTKRHEGRGPFRKLRKMLEGAMANKGFTIVMSFLIAVTIWSVLVASDGTLTRHKTFPNVATSVIGETTLKSRGYIVMDDLSELVPAVKMTVEVAQSNFNRVSGTSYNPHFELSQIKGEGENELSIVYSSQLYGPVVSCEPDHVTVNVERYITKRVPVVLEITGKLPDGLYLDNYKTDPSTLAVSGPQSLVSKAARIVVRLDQSMLSAERMNDRTALGIEIQDAKGGRIESNKIEVTNQSVITNAVIVETELSPMKYVKLDAKNFVTGEPAEGYELYGVELAESELLVAARREMLDSILTLTTDTPLDITGANGDRSGQVKLKRPAGLDNTLPTEMGVIARIREKSIERTFKKVPIEVEGLSEGQSVTLSNSRVHAQIKGGYHFVEGLEMQDIHLFVDLEGLEDGTHEVPVQIHIDNPKKFTCALSMPQVEATIETKTP